MLKGKEALRKNLLRVKQLADQGLGRAEKSEVLSEDLINAEKKVECLKQICLTTTKKLSSLMQTSSSSSGDSEKKAKKVPGNVIGAAFEENAITLGEGILHDTFVSCAEGHYALGKDFVDYERHTETTFLQYLQDLLENDIPALQKTKRNLTKLTLDMDSARTRFLSSQKQTAVAKTDSLKEELEDASVKVEQCKDQYATDMYTFVAKEPEICAKLVEWLEAEAVLHNRAVNTLNELIPRLKDDIGRHSVKPLFGTALEEHLKSTDRDVALVIEVCIDTLAQIAMDEEGLFRIAGSASKVKKLLAAFNAGTVDMAEYVTDVHAIAGVLKQYLRELPEPLLTSALLTEWMRVVQLKDHEQRMRHLWTTVQKLPKANFTNLRYLIKFLAKLAENSEVNKMSPNNLAIVMGPNLLWAVDDEGPSVLSIAAIQSIVAELLITHHSYFFPGDIEFIEAEKTSIEAQLTKKDSMSNVDVSLSAVSASSNGGNMSHAVVPHASDIADFKTSPRVSRAPSKKHAPPIPPRLEAPAAPGTSLRPASSIAPGRPMGPPPAVPAGGSVAASLAVHSPPPSPATGSEAGTVAKMQQSPKAGLQSIHRVELGPPPPPPLSRTVQEPPAAAAATETAGVLDSMRTAPGGHVRTPGGPGHARTPSGGERAWVMPSGGPSGEHTRLPSSSSEVKVPPPIPERRGSKPSEHGAGDVGGAATGDGQDSSASGRHAERANSINKETLL